MAATNQNPFTQPLTTPLFVQPTPTVRPPTIVERARAVGINIGGRGAQQMANAVAPILDATNLRQIDSAVDTAVNLPPAAFDYAKKKRDAFVSQILAALGAQPGWTELSGYPTQALLADLSAQEAEARQRAEFAAASRGIVPAFEAQITSANRDALARIRALTEQALAAVNDPRLSERLTGRVLSGDLATPAEAIAALQAARADQARRVTANAPRSLGSHFAEVSSRSPPVRRLTGRNVGSQPAVFGVLATPGGLENLSPEAYNAVFGSVQQSFKGR